MQKFSLILVLCLLFRTSLMAQPAEQSGHDISISLTPVKNQWIYLGFYYGKIKALADSVRLDANSSGHFKGKDKLPGGIYFLVSPKKEILFEVLIDKDQHFSIKADSGNIPAAIRFEG